MTRFWKLYGGRSEVVGAIVARDEAPAMVTSASPAQWWAVTSQAGLGHTETTRETLDGRRFAVTPIAGPELQAWTAAGTIAAAIEHLEAVKAVNLAAGWVEVPLDAINDPD
jgi:hypothetical protein